MSARGEVQVPSAAAEPFAGLTCSFCARASDYLQLAKARLSSMVLLSGLVGFWLASSVVSWSGLVWFAAGTFLVVAGANAFNQVLERDRDALMERTARRPLPSGRLGVAEASAAAALMSVAGLGILLLGASATSAALGLLALVTYVLVYTPLKSRTPWSTVPGAIAGAMPPLMGWTAVRPEMAELSPLAWCLFGIVFFWQFPHTWAIASAYRQQYARAGYRAAAVDGTKVRTVGLTAMLVAVSLLPAGLGLTGAIYLVGAGLAGAVVLVAAVRFGNGTLRSTAIQLLVVSLFYLPLVLMLLALDGKVV